MKNNSQQGYVALITVIILGVVLLVAVLGFSLLMFFNTHSTTNALLKESSYFAARACLEKALLNITVDPDYAGGDNLSVDGDPCTITSVTQEGANRIIITTSTIRRAQTTLELTVGNNLETVTFTER
jgi:hypothetical protein